MGTKVVFVCVDNDNGMMFNNRRCSSDITVTQRILDWVKERNKTLCMEAYSKPLFDKIPDHGVPIKIFDTARELVNSDEEILFVERNDCFDVYPHTLIMFRWNRSYPSDTKFCMDLQDSFLMVESEEFFGVSHDNITKEVYVL